MNSTKTQTLSVGSCAYHYSLFLNNARIEFLRSIKILGVTLDKDLAYKEHISDQLKKAYAKASALRRIRRFFAIFCVHSSASASSSSAFAPHTETSSSDSPLLNFFSSILSFCVLTSSVVLAIEAWCLSKASLSPLAIICGFLGSKTQGFEFSINTARKKTFK